MYSHFREEKREALRATGSDEVTGLVGGGAQQAPQRPRWHFPMERSFQPSPCFAVEEAEAPGAPGPQ